MTALSPLRTGRITGSRVGAILGLNRYQTRDDVMREMVRDHFGAAPEFTGNEATAWGQAHEEEARTAYERLTGALVVDAQDFIIHPDYPWIGISPDGLTGADGMVEIKSPWRARYMSIDTKPDYYAQVQLQLHCSGRAWCDFVIFRPGEPMIVQRVDINPGWMGDNIAVLCAFHAEYEQVIADPDLAAPFLADRDRSDAAWRAAADELRAADTLATEAAGRVDAAKTRLRELAGDAGARGCGVAVIVSERAGQVDWQKVAGKYAPDADPEPFRKATSRVVTVREIKEEP